LSNGAPPRATLAGGAGSTTHVPVGEDQLQHLELARELARSMNHQYKASLFVEPQPILGVLSTEKRHGAPSFCTDRTASVWPLLPPL